MRGSAGRRCRSTSWLGTVLLNFVLDPLLIFGWGPVPGYGVMGAAIATLVTQGIAAIIGIVILRRGMHGVHVRRARPHPRLRLREARLLPGLPRLDRDVGARARR